MKLFEIFDTKSTWKWISTDTSDYFAQLKVDDKIYFVNFTPEISKFVSKHLGFEPPPNVWEVDFRLMKQGDRLKNTHYMTGTGNEFQVMAGVLEIIQSFISQEHPAALTFIANEPSRKSLYNKMAHKFSNNVMIANFEKTGDSIYYIPL